MKLMLTSNGLSNKKLKEEFVRILDKRITEVRVLVIRNTPKTQENDEYFLDIVEELKETGVRKENIIFANIKKDISASDYKVEDYDVFWSSGGNTFTILDRIRKTGFDDWIKKFIQSDKVYVGTSAGTIILSGNIEIAGMGKEHDENYIELLDLRGLNILDYAVFPHYTDEQQKDVEEIRKKVKYPVRVLKDGEAIIIKGKKDKFV